MRRVQRYFFYILADIHGSCQVSVTVISISTSNSAFAKRSADDVEAIQEFAHKKAVAETDRATYQAMEALVHNLNTMHSRAEAVRNASPSGLVSMLPPLPCLGIGAPSEEGINPFAPNMDNSCATCC